MYSSEKRNIIIKTQTSELSCNISGEKNDQLVILLHGGPGVPDYLDELAGILEKEMMVLRFDQRGVGKSKVLNDSYKLEDYVSDINAIINYLKVEKVHIFGHSWGALLAQYFATYNPEKVKSLFLASPSSGFGDLWKKMEKEVMSYNKSKASFFEWLLMGWNSLWGAFGFDSAYKKIFSNVWRFYFKEPRLIPKPELDWLDGISAKAINKTRKDILEINNVDFIEKFSSLNIEMIFTYGSYDIYGPSKNINLEKLNGVRIFEFKNAGHLPWLQDRQEFKKLILDFYRKQENNN